MLGVSASRSWPARPGLLQPGRFGACHSRPVAGSKTPGLPTTVWTIRLQRTPASATTARACAAAAREVGAGERPVAAQTLEQRALVVRSKQRRGAGGSVEVSHA